ncbi:MAG: hypothetical protein A2Z96_05815 [Spirochaetes bacterium GWB1_48_6]|nr:MAG: hypothetical protein A2Z96_05815 [Spirochaetes bacterium GWB1_48_6]
MTVRDWKRLLGVSLLLCLFSISTAFSQNGQRYLDLDSRAYTFFDAIFLEQGLAEASTARPWSMEQARHELERIDTSVLSSAGTLAYEYLNSIFAYAGSMNAGFNAALNFVTSPQGFVHANLRSDESYEASEYTWVRGYENRNAFLEIPVDFWLDSGFYAYMNLEIKEEHATVDGGGNYFNVVLDDPYPQIDLYFPFQAYTSLGGPGWSFRFGRDRLSWGNGRTGNMLLSDYSDFYDFLGLTLFGKKATLNSVYALLDAFDAKTLEPSVYSALMAHRLDLRLTDRLVISLNESVVFGNQEPELVRDLNYLMIFHNWMIPSRSNSLMSLEFNYTPLTDFQIYGQIAMDEFATTYEEERSGGGGPPIFGFMLGTDGVYPMGSGYLTGGAEWAMTSPWMYSRRKAPYYYNVRRYWSLTEDAYEYIVKPIGYRYGPDAIVWNIHVGYDIPEGLELGLEGTYLIKGTTTLATAWNPQEGDAAPSGLNPERTFTLSFDASYPVRTWIEIGLGLTFISSRDIGHIEGTYSDDLELSAYASLQF